MNRAPGQVRSGFLGRYYRWASLQWEQELASAYPTLREFGGFSSAALVALEILEALTPADRMAMSRSLVRRAHKEALSFQGERLSSTEEELLKRWLEMSRGVRHSRMFHLETHNMDLRKLRSALKQVLGPILGQETSSSSGKGLGYEKSVEPWSLATDIDLGGRNHQLTYFHAVSWQGQFVKSSIGPLEWLGISATALDRVSEREEEKAAECVAGLVRRFLSAQQLLMMQA